MATWPGTLPQYPLREGYSDEAGFPVVQAPVAGPPLARRRFTAATDVVSMQFQFTDAQLATFETFYRDTLARGALSYTAPNIVSGAGTATFRMTAGPKKVRSGKGWRVSLTLIRLP